MGGSAFASRGLATPRMPATIYQQVLSRTHRILKGCYRDVGTPIEAPGKEDYGDIDVIVHSPLSEEFDHRTTPATIVASNISKALGAINTIGAFPLINLAIPYPGEEKQYIQVDVHISPSKKALDWELFHTAHGDLWNMLGSTIRGFGITVNDNGMYLRIPQIEALDRNKAKVFLTDDSNTILDFLGMDAEKWWKPFQTPQELFEYAASCRLFWVKETKAEGEVEGDVMVGNIKGEQEGGQEGGEKGKKKLKHNDRARMKKRSLFRLWVEEFIPKCREEGKFGNTEITREEVHAQAFARFGIAQEYQTRLQEWELLRNRDAVWKFAIKGTIPEGTDSVLKGAASRTLKLVILEGELFDGYVPKAAQKNENGLYDLDEVQSFVAKNWEKAGEIGLERGKEKMIANMKEQAKKKSLKNDAEEGRNSS